MKKRRRRAQSDTMIAALVDGADYVDVVLSLVRGRVAAVIFPVDQGDTIKVSASLLRAAVEMIDGVDGER